MSDKSSLQQAAQTLLVQFGARLPSGHEEGRKQMREALQERLGISGHDAQKLVDDLVEARTIRWVNGRTPNRTNVDGPPIVAGATAQQTEYVFGAVFDEGGYWQLGDDTNPT